MRKNDSSSDFFGCRETETAGEKGYVRHGHDAALDTDG